MTTTRITHATPSAVYAHTADRNGEANIPAEVINPARCPDIGWQLIHGPDNDRIQVGPVKGVFIMATEGNFKPLYAWAAILLRVFKVCC